MDSLTELHLKPSATHARVLIAAHILCGMLLLLLPLAGSLRGALSGLLVAGWAWAWRQRSVGRDIRGLSRRGEQWFVRRADGAELPVAAFRVHYLGRWLVILGVSGADGFQHRLTIFGDALGVDEFRRLRVLLRLARRP